MRILKDFKIKREVDLIYAKREIGEFLKKINYFHIDFLLFATMEFGTNILKHAKSGEIWLLEHKKELYLAALDNGPGVIDAKWCIKKGTTTYKNSLGLGLYSLTKNEYFELEIFSRLFKGSVFLLKPKGEYKNICFQKPYIHERFLGDVIVKRDEFTLFADVSGHGKRAWESGEFIKEIFLKYPKKFLFSEDFFKFLHLEIKKYNYRSAVVGIIKESEEFIEIIGVGDIEIFSKQEGKVFRHFLKAGILGEIYYHTNYLKFNKKNSKIILVTDGIDDYIVKDFLDKKISNELLAISSVFYSKRTDDKSILILGER